MEVSLKSHIAGNTYLLALFFIEETSTLSTFRPHEYDQEEHYQDLNYHHFWKNDNTKPFQSKLC